MRSVFGIVLAALSMVGLACQNNVVTPPTLAVTFPRVTLLLVAAPGVMIAPAAKPSKPVATISRPVAAGIVLGTSTIALASEPTPNAKSDAVKPASA
jgi:hypothetical protein